MRAADGSLIRCPKCRWVPVQEARWSCNCGQIWNTFQTRGICSACQYQWEVTLCYGCHEASRHAAWTGQTIGEPLKAEEDVYVMIAAAASEMAISCSPDPPDTPTPPTTSPSILMGTPP
jgi:hypothetical protein